MHVSFWPASWATWSNWDAPPPRNSGKWRLIGIPYCKCNNADGHWCWGSFVEPKRLDTNQITFAHRPTVSSQWTNSVVYICCQHDLYRLWTHASNLYIQMMCFSASDVVCLDNIYIYMPATLQETPVRANFGWCERKGDFWRLKVHTKSKLDVRNVTGQCSLDAWRNRIQYSPTSRWDSCEQLGRDVSTDVAGWSPTKDVEHEANIVASMAQVFYDPMMRMAAVSSRLGFLSIGARPGEVGKARTESIPPCIMRS